jgi:hypothetical protein
MEDDKDLSSSQADVEDGVYLSSRRSAPGPDQPVDLMFDRRGSGGLTSSSTNASEYPWLFNSGAASVSNIETRQRYAALVSLGTKAWHVLVVGATDGMHH